MDIDDFKNKKEELTQTLAAAIEKTMRDMGSDVRGLSWFSSNAQFHPKNNIA